MKDRIKRNKIKLTIPELQEKMKSYYGMYFHYMTKQSSKKQFDYMQWSNTVVVNGELINSMPFIKGLIKISIWFENPLFQCDVKQVDSVYIPYESKPKTI